MYNCLQKIKAHFSPKLRKLLASLVVFMMICVGAQAATYYWVGAQNGDWNNPSNWNTQANGLGTTPTELLSSRNNYGVINSLKAHYDIIILDCAPVLGINDTQMLLKYSDANLVIVTSGETSFEVLERTKRQFEQLGSKIDGVVINKANVKGSSYYYYTNDYYTSTTKTDKVERVEKK